METAFIFPAFVPEYLGNETQLLQAYPNNFQYFLDTAANLLDAELKEFSITDNNFNEQELRSQLMSYIFSCSISDLLKAQQLKPDCLAGYSMGLYASLYCGDSISFEEGLLLITEAYDLMQTAAQGVDCGMASIIGLTKPEIEDLIDLSWGHLEVVNVNAKLSHLISGERIGLDLLLDKARREGALSASSLNVTTPYHTKILESAALPFLGFMEKKIVLKASTYPIYSCINGNLIQQADHIRMELANNMHQHINWQLCFQSMLDAGIDSFVECGAGRSLHNICRFMEGDFKVFPINKMHKLLHRDRS